MSKLHSKKTKLFLLVLLIILGLGIFYPNKIRANTLSVSQSGQDSAPVLDYIAINNQVVDQDNSDKVRVAEGDAVKIAGQAQPGAKITIVFGERKLETTVDKYGNWFVLFSVLNLEDGFYNIQAKLEKSENFSSLTAPSNEGEQEVTLGTLSLGDVTEEEAMEVEGNGLFATQTSSLNNIKTKRLITYLITAIILAGIVIGVIFISKNEQLMAKVKEIKEKVFIKRQNE